MKTVPGRTGRHHLEWPQPNFECGAFNHSATSPERRPQTRSAPSPRSLRGEGWGEGREGPHDVFAPHPYPHPASRAGKGSDRVCRKGWGEGQGAVCTAGQEVRAGLRATATATSSMGSGAARAWTCARAWEPKCRKAAFADPKAIRILGFRKSAERE
jgi:hypothetical protein